jgi:hypothetical protein
MTAFHRNPDRSRGTLSGTGNFHYKTRRSSGFRNGIGGKRQKCEFFLLFFARNVTLIAALDRSGRQQHSPNQARFCQWSLRFIQRNSIQETRAKWNKVL